MLSLHHGGVEESAGFIKLLGQSTATWTDINKK